MAILTVCIDTLHLSAETAHFTCLYLLFQFVAFSLFIQSNLESSNTEGFTIANSNSFLSPYDSLLIVSRNQILREIFLLYHEIVCCVYSLESLHRGHSNNTQHTLL